MRYVYTAAHLPPRICTAAEFSRIQVDDTRRVFARKGFAEPRMFELGDMQLWLYQKQLVNTPNFVERENGDKLFATGTVVYRGLGYRDSLRRLLEDLTDNRLDWDELIGSFCLLSWNGSRLQLIRDRSNNFQFSVFDNGTCLSSSFLAMVTASPGPLALNTLAVLEKLATGVIIAPDTAVNGILKLDSRLNSPFPEKEGSISVIGPGTPRKTVNSLANEPVFTLN